MNAQRRAAAALAVLALAGCASVGPPSVPRDRLDYVSAISESWKQQTLLNLLKVRYGDVPVFLDVTSVINAYSFDNEASFSAQGAPVGRGDTFLSLGGSTRYSDHPTITYIPLTGDKFAKSIMAPIPVPAILLLVQSGYPADVVLRFAVNAINGMTNASGGPSARAGDPRFGELLALLRAEQVAGGLGFEARQEDRRTRNVMLLRPPLDPPMAQRHERIRALLGLAADLKEYDVAFGSFPSGGTEVALLSRSILQVMLDVSSHIETPAGDIERGSLPARVEMPSGLAPPPPPVRVQSSTEMPGDAFVSVRYRGHWFWIDDREYASKAAFSFLMLLFSLTETSSAQSAPVMTVPTR